MHVRAAPSPTAAAAAAAPAAQELSRAALRTAFTPRLEDFDLLLTLRPEALPRVRGWVRLRVPRVRGWVRLPCVSGWVKKDTVLFPPPP